MLPFVLAAGIALAAFFVRGFTGFGSALVMTPLLALVFDPRLAVASTALLGATIGAGIAWGSRREVDWPVLLRCLLVALPCIVIGAVLLARANEGVLRRGLGLVVIAFGARVLLSLRAGASRRRRWSPRAGYVAGGLGGLLGGAFGTGGPPLVVFLENQIDNRLTLRATVLAAVLALDVARLPSYLLTGVYTQRILAAGLVMLPAALIGGLAGSRMHVHVSEPVFRGVLGTFLLASGTLLVVG